MLEWINDIYTYLLQLDINQIQGLLEKYSSLGPLPGIALPALEALLPFLPLFIIIAGNASAYGLVLGFVYSWVGTVLGSCLVFLVARRFGGRLNTYLSNKYPQADRFFSWIESRGFTPLFILYCLPFTPSFFVNVASGVSAVPKRVFFPAIIFGKAVMVLMLSYMGYDWKGFIIYPWRMLLVAAGLLILWFIGKRVEKYYQLH